VKFYTADWHLGHANIIKFCKRPFKDIFEMREFLIKAHNDRVKRGDTTYHIGDMFWRTMSIVEARYVMSRLNGYHKFVYGNHDQLMDGSPELRACFAEVADALWVPHTKLHKGMYLHHYACRVWRDSHKGSYHLYGHSHAALPEANTLSFDCGVDSRPDYAPWSEEEVDAKMKAKKAAGAKDEMEAEIAANPWNKAEGAQAPYPLLEVPKIPDAAWDAIEEARVAFEAETGAKWSPLNINGRCV